MKRPSRTRIACGVALALLLVSAAADAQAVAPGTLLSAEPLAGAPGGARAWRIRYASTTDQDAPEEVTGVVVVPSGEAPPGGRPVLAWAHGTWGVVEKCAPSLSPNFFAATPGLSNAMARGYVVVATDYAGLGTPQPHAYLIGKSAAHAVLDSVRAAGNMPQAKAGKTFAVWGESQGGHAALFTGELASTYAPELRLVGVAASAPTTDLVANLAGDGDPSIRAFITAWAAYSWSKHFGVSLASLGSSSVQKRITQLAQNCIVIDQTPGLRTIIGVSLLRRDLKGVDVGHIEPWATIARENSAGRLPAGAPVFIAQNPKDVIVAPAVTRQFAKNLCASGASVRYVVLDGAGHATSGSDSARAVIEWITDRLDGKPVPSDCSTL